MSMRSSIRAIAKARLKAMGVPHVNKVLRLGMSHTQTQNLHQTGAQAVFNDSKAASAALAACDQRTFS